MSAPPMPGSRFAFRTVAKQMLACEKCGRQATMDGGGAEGDTCGGAFGQGRCSGTMRVWVMRDESGLTDHEQRVLQASVRLTNAFADLEREEGASHPSHASDVADAIHAIQRIVAVRRARRADPAHWGVLE